MQGLNIQNITITSNNTNDINVKTKVGDSYTFYYYSSNYEILNNIINLNICYSAGLNPSYTTLENDFILLNINVATANYTLIVNVKERQYLGNNLWTCDNSTIGNDTETIQFSTPLTTPVSLLLATFENLKQKINVFPNPVTTTFQVQYQSIKEIQLYDNFGRLVKEFLKPQTNYDISDLCSGIYYVQIKDALGNLFKEKLIKK